MCVKTVYGFVKCFIDKQFLPWPLQDIWVVSWTFYGAAGITIVWKVIDLKYVNIDYSCYCDKDFIEALTKFSLYPSKSLAFCSCLATILLLFSKNTVNAHPIMKKINTTEPKIILIGRKTNMIRIITFTHALIGNINRNFTSLKSSRLKTGLRLIQLI